MSYEEFLKAVKEDAIKLELNAFDKEEAEKKINDAWSDMYESFGENMCKDQYNAIKEAEKKFADGKMSENIYKARVKQNIGMAAWNIWMLA